RRLEDDVADDSGKDRARAKAPRHAPGDHRAAGAAVEIEAAIRERRLRSQEDRRKTVWVWEKVWRASAAERAGAMSERKLVIAIDGPAGAGKSTIASRIARKLGYTNIE